MPISPFLDYLEFERKYSPHTILAYRKDLEQFADFVQTEFGLDHLKEMNYSMVRSWIVALVQEGVTNQTVNRKISSLKSYYKFLLKTQQIDENPLAKHKALKTSKKLQVPFSQREIE
ncbi:MAG: site-specific integrase, partial [Bacteroidia bacterium]|nr:site-specific integrase [Bacteroidia bacterium]